MPRGAWASPPRDPGLGRVGCRLPGRPGQGPWGPDPTACRGSGDPQGCLLSQGFLKPWMAPFSVGQTPVTRYLSVTAEAGGWRWASSWRLEAGDGPVAGPGFSVGAPLCERWSGFSPVWLSPRPPQRHQIPTSFLQGLEMQRSSPWGVWKPWPLKGGCFGQLWVTQGWGQVSGSTTTMTGVGAHGACSPKPELWGPSGPCRPPPQIGCVCLYVNVCEEFCTVPSNNVRESNLINLRFDICLRHTPGGMSGLSNRFL